MINVCVCDDVEQCCDEIAQMIKAYCKNLKEEIWVDKFYTGDSLLEAMDKEKYDIFFLDIDIDSISGLQIAEKLRVKQENDEAQIIFISSHTEYAMKLFEVRPLNFLVKPVNQYKLNEVLEKALSLISLDKNVLLIKTTDNNMIRQEIKKILYIEGMGRKIRIYTTDGEYISYGRLKDIYDQLKMYRFIYIHKSYIVNYNQIKAINADSVVMYNKDVLKISERKKKDISRYIIQFEGR